MRNDPWNWLPPLLVITLTTPPPKRPYSAEMPEVRTCVSSMASSMNRLFEVPNRLSLVSTPSIRKMLSKAKAPPTAICPTFGRVVGDAGRELGDLERPPADRQGVDQLRPVSSPTVCVVASVGGVDVGDDVHGLRDAAQPQRRIELRQAAERNVNDVA